MSATLDTMIARLTEDGAAFGKGSAYADLHAICCALDAARLRALDERNELAKALRELVTAETGCVPPLDESTKLGVSYLRARALLARIDGGGE